MYRVIKMGAKYYAVKLDENNIRKEYEEIEAYVQNDGYEVIITDDYEQYNATLIIRD